MDSFHLHTILLLRVLHVRELVACVSRPSDTGRFVLLHDLQDSPEQRVGHVEDEEAPDLEDLMPN